MIPGYSTEKLETFASREEYLKDLLAYGNKPARRYKTTYENGEKMEEDLEKFSVVGEIDNRIKNMTAKLKVTLSAPRTLTVKQSDGGFKRRAHIGGEEFALTGVYQGKKDLIYTFSPVAAETYVSMEMNEATAEDALYGFKAIRDQLCSGGLLQARNEAVKNAALEKEREKLADKFKQYDDFGTF